MKPLEQSELIPVQSTSGSDQISAKKISQRSAEDAASLSLPPTNLSTTKDQNPNDETQPCQQLINTNNVASNKEIVAVSSNIENDPMHLKSILQIPAIDKADFPILVNKSTKTSAENTNKLPQVCVNASKGCSLLGPKSVEPDMLLNEPNHAPAFQVKKMIPEGFDSKEISPILKPGKHRPTYCRSAEALARRKKASLEKLSKKRQLKAAAESSNSDNQTSDIKSCYTQFDHCHNSHQVIDNDDTNYHHVQHNIMNDTEVKNQKHLVTKKTEVWNDHDCLEVNEYPEDISSHYHQIVNYSVSGHNIVDRNVAPYNDHISSTTNSFYNRETSNFQVVRSKSLTNHHCCKNEGKQTFSKPSHHLKDKVLNTEYYNDQLVKQHISLNSHLTTNQCKKKVLLKTPNIQKNSKEENVCCPSIEPLMQKQKKEPMSVEARRAKRRRERARRKMRRLEASAIVPHQSPITVGLPTIIPNQPPTIKNMQLNCEIKADLAISNLNCKGKIPNDQYKVMENNLPPSSTKEFVYQRQLVDSLKGNHFKDDNALLKDDKGNFHYYDNKTMLQRPGQTEQATSDKNHFKDNSITAKHWKKDKMLFHHGTNSILVQSNQEGNSFSNKEFQWQINNALEGKKQAENKHYPSHDVNSQYYHKRKLMPLAFYQNYNITQYNEISSVNNTFEWLKKTDSSYDNYLKEECCNTSNNTKNQESIYLNHKNNNVVTDIKKAPTCYKRQLWQMETSSSSSSDLKRSKCQNVEPTDPEWIEHNKFCDYLDKSMDTDYLDKSMDTEKKMQKERLYTDCYEKNKKRLDSVEKYEDSFDGQRLFMNELALQIMKDS